LSIKKSTLIIDDEIAAIFLEDEVSEEELRTLATALPATLNKLAEPFSLAMDLLKEAMILVSKELNMLWGNERYVRVTAADDYLE